MATHTTKPDEQDLILYKGDDYAETFPILDDDSVAMVLTGFTAKAQIRKSQKRSSTLIAEFTASLENPSTGLVNLSLTDDVTASISEKEGYWDLLLTDANDFTETYIMGKVTFVDTVTKKT